jgi:hypothetical protein
MEKPMNWFKQPWVLFIGEVLTGALFGGILAYLSGFIIGSMSPRQSDVGFDGLIRVLSALLIAYPLGVAIGNTFFNRQFRGRSYFWLALLGSVGGIVLAMGLAEPLRLNVNTNVMFIFLGILPPSLAAIFGRFRRKSMGV